VLKKFLRKQKGLALPIVLCVLAIGGLTIAGGLNYAATSINGSRIIADSLQGAYAAEAGIEETLWCLLHGTPPSTQLTDSINQMTVDIETEDTGFYTLYFGEMIEAGEHYDFISVNGELVWDDEAGIYRYTITVTVQHDSTIHINEVGARLPPGFSYDWDSAALFPENLSGSEPLISADSSGAFMLRWVFSAPVPDIPAYESANQTFYVNDNGGGDTEDEYAWVVANRSDIGAVGEISGNKYCITARAKRSGDNKTCARLKSDVLVTGGVAYIVSWHRYLTN